MVGGRAGAISHETVKWSPSKLVKWSPSLQSPYHHSLGTLCGAGLLGATGRFGCFRFRSNTSLLLYTWRKSASGPPARDPLPRHAASRNGAVFMYIFQVLTVCCSQCFAVCVCVCVCVCVFALAQVRALVLAVIVDIRKKILRAAAGRPSSPPCSACGF